MLQNQIYQNLTKKYEKDKEVLFKKTKTTTKGDEDDLVHTDNYKDTNNEEPEEKYQIEEIKKIIQNQITQKLMKEIRYKMKNQL